MKNRIIKPAILFGLTACTAIIVLFACNKSGGGNDGGYGGGNSGGGTSGNSVTIAGFAFS